MASRDNIRIVNQLIAGTATETLKISGADVFFLANQRVTTPGTPTGGGYLFVSGGSLQFVGTSGTLTRIALP